MLSSKKKICYELHAGNLAESSLPDAKQQTFKQTPLSTMGDSRARITPGVLSANSSEESPVPGVTQNMRRATLAAKPL